MIFNGDREKLGRYLRELADLVGLRDWTINLMHGVPENPNHAACIEVRYGRKVANIWFQERWAEDDPETLRSTCVHELIHCHMEPMEWGVNNVAGLLGVPAFTVLLGSYRDAMESAVDAIATEWATTLPLPIKRKRKGGTP